MNSTFAFTILKFIGDVVPENSVQSRLTVPIPLTLFLQEPFKCF